MDAVVLARVPQGLPEPEDFAMVAESRRSLGEGQVRLRVLELSLDPYVRSLLGGRHLDDAPVRPGDVVPGRAVAEVVESRSDIPLGTHLLAETGWRTEAVVDADSTARVETPAGVSPSVALGALGMPGLTAYAAVRRHLLVRPGDTVVIGSATGGVGAVAGCLAARAGARTVAIVGSEDKAEAATSALGFDAAVRRGPGLAAELAEACPERIDGYLHLGDQATLDVVMEQLATGARVSLCGLMDQANGAARTRMRAGAVITARAEVRGMVVYDHVDLAEEHRREVGALLASGELVPPEDRFDGLDRAPVAFCRMMRGDNLGKVVVTVNR